MQMQSNAPTQLSSGLLFYLDVLNLRATFSKSLSSFGSFENFRTLSRTATVSCNKLYAVADPIPFVTIMSMTAPPAKMRSVMASLVSGFNVELLLSVDFCFCLESKGVIRFVRVKKALRDMQKRRRKVLLSSLADIA